MKPVGNIDIDISFFMCTLLVNYVRGNEYDIRNCFSYSGVSLLAVSLIRGGIFTMTRRITRRWLGHVQGRESGQGNESAHQDGKSQAEQAASWAEDRILPRMASKTASRYHLGVASRRRR